MRAKQSSTATAMYGNIGVCTFSSTPIYSRAARFKDKSTGPRPLTSGGKKPDDSESGSCVESGQSSCSALLHDARNLLGALSLYSDLLSMPGVLKPEHREYADDLRLVGQRSEALIERMMGQLLEMGVDDLAQRAPFGGSVARRSTDELRVDGIRGEHRTGRTREVQGGSGKPGGMDEVARPIGLRGVVERCAGLLRQVAGGRAVEIVYGEAAAAGVCVPEESVERILVNLVRNAAAAVDRQRPAGEGMRPGGAIRIGVGMLSDPHSEPKPWPFAHVRLTVEDSGCGMTAVQVETLFCAQAPDLLNGHGMGFRIIRDLIAASRGHIGVKSVPGSGTRVVVEWPLAPWGATETLPEPRVSAGMRLPGILPLLSTDTTDLNMERWDRADALWPADGKGCVTC